MSPAIYLDNNATTPVDERVFAAMEPYFSKHFGNAASATHAYGWEAAQAVDEARRVIADAIGAPAPESVIFTSGTTESNNLVLKGLFFANKCQNGFHIITQKTEHESLLNTCEFLRGLGAGITILEVDKDGLVAPDAVRRALRPDTRLVSIMHANNEIGTIQDIAHIAHIVHEQPGVLFHTDAAQTVGKLPIDVARDHIDLMSFSAHKIYGPKGIGALYIAPKVPAIRLNPLLHGGGHEFALRSGTLNVPAIVGFARALALCVDELDAESKRESELRDFFISAVKDKLDHVTLNGHPTRRLANNINLTFKFVDSEKLIMAMPGIAVSTGSACASGGTEPSYVIQALGRSQAEAGASIRIGLGRFTTRQEIQTAIEVITQTVKKLREVSLEYQMFLSAGNKPQPI